MTSSTRPGQAGVRYFDAARSYGRAEAFLAALACRAAASSPPRSRSARSGATPTPPAGRSTPTSTRSRTTRSPPAPPARREPGAPGTHLALYQIHSATLESGVLDDRGCWTSWRAAARRGLRSASPSPAPRQADDDRAGARRSAAVRLRPGDLEPARALRRRRRWQAAHAAGLGVIVKEALANGRLTERGGIEPFLAAAREQRGRARRAGAGLRAGPAVRRRRPERSGDRRAARQQPSGAGAGRDGRRRTRWARRGSRPVLGRALGAGLGLRGSTPPSGRRCRRPGRPSRRCRCAGTAGSCR